MRLWHKDLIHYLPRQQLLGQWRECCLIAKAIREHGTPNHILVNRILDYPMIDFVTYSYMVWKEMHDRGYSVDFNKFGKRLDASDDSIFECWYLDYDKIFDTWHNWRYLRECLYNLEEKYICGGIPEDDWHRIYNRFGRDFDLYC